MVSHMHLAVITIRYNKKCYSVRFGQVSNILGSAPVPATKSTTPFNFVLSTYSLRTLYDDSLVLHTSLFVRSSWVMNGNSTDVPPP